MRRLLPSTVLLVLGVAAAWWFVRSDRAASPDDRGPEHSDVLTLEGAGPQAPERAPERAAVAADAAEQRGSSASDSTPVPEREAADGRVLRGVLVDAETDLPLGGHALRLWRPFGREELATVTTEADGRFETGPLPYGGVVIVHVPDSASRERALQRELEPMSVEIVEDTGGAPLEVRVRARRPPGVVTVIVLAEDGSPAPGARVALSEISARRRYESETTTDPDGVAVLGLWDPGNLESAQVRATRSPDEKHAASAGAPPAAVSDLLAIPAPIEDYPRQLQLGPPAGLAVRVRTATGAPVPDARLRVQADTPHGPSYGWAWTDGGGGWESRGLHPGPAYVAVDNPSLGHAESRRVELVRGAVTRLEVQLRDGPRRIAARGRAVDLDGATGVADVQVAYRAGDGERQTTTTDAEGNFACWSVPAEPIWLSANLDPDGDAWSPASLELPFGSEGVRFERGEDVPAVTFRMEVVSARTGEPFEHYYAAIDLGPGTEEWGYSLARRAEFELRVREGTRWRIAAEHHLVATIDLHAELQVLPAGEPLVVRLSPGFDAHVEVLDAETEEPVAGALFRSRDAPEVRTDARGRVHLQAEVWPAWRITAPGYEDETFDPVDFFLFDWPPVYLQPAE